MSTRKNTPIKSSKNQTSDGYSYLTTRILVSKARAAGIKASADAMDLMGYIVTLEGNNVVKKFADGKIEIISTIDQETQGLLLD